MLDGLRLLLGEAACRRADDKSATVSCALRGASRRDEDVCRDVLREGPREGSELLSVWRLARMALAFLGLGAVGGPASSGAGVVVCSLLPSAPPATGRSLAPKVAAEAAAEGTALFSGGGTGGLPTLAGDCCWLSV